MPGIDCAVEVIEDVGWPDGLDWMFVRAVDRSLVLLVAESSATDSRALAEAREAYGRIEAGEPTLVRWPPLEPSAHQG